MKLIPEVKRYAAPMLLLSQKNLPENPVAFELDIEETRIPKEEAKFLGGSVYCCKECLQKEWMAT